MSVTAESRGQTDAAGQAARLQRPSAVLCVFVAVITFLAYAGYVLHWSWIGLNGRSATLWEWLNLVLLPLAFTVVPIVYLRRSTLRMPSPTTLLASAGAIALFILASYEVPLRWTGFSGNTLWDWLKLLLPPLAVVFVACAGSVRSAALSDHGLRLAAVALGLGVPVLGGYLWGWEWTGFAGQTLWDWLRLLLAPVAIPTVLAPALSSVAREIVRDAAIREAAIRGTAPAAGDGGDAAEAVV